jgi:hypothetical protein
MKCLGVSSLNVKCYQYDETNVMHFSFSLLRIKGLYMFLALLAVLTATMPQPTDTTHTQYTKHQFAAPTDDEQVTHNPASGPSYSIN